jgi:hypothetical protein
MTKKKKEHPDRGGVERWNLEQSASSVASEDLWSQRFDLEDSELPSSSKSTKMPKQYCDHTSPTSRSTQTSAPTIQQEESSTLFGEDSPVPTQAAPETEKDLKEKPAASGGNNSESSEPSDQYSVSLSSLPELSTEDYERFLADSEWQDIKAKLKSSRRRSLVRDTADPACLLFPTLTACNSGNSRPAGQTKCEKWWKDKGLIPSGSQLGTGAIASIMGFPSDWFKGLTKFYSKNATTPNLPTPQDASEPDPLQVEVSPQHKQLSLYNESDILTNLEDRTMNIKKIAVNNWVTSQNKVGKIVREGEKGEFWGLWSGDSLPMNESAKSLQIADYDGEDLAGKTFKDGRCNRLFYEYGVKAEVYLEHKKKPQIWSLEKLNQELKSEEQPPFDKPTMLSLSKIRCDGGTQSRATIDPTTVDEYAEDYKNGANFPPITVFYDGNYYWLVDGFPRKKAALKAGLNEIEAIVKQGTRRDAVLYSVGVNATHGLRRTNADKRRAVMTLLEDEEWSHLSNNAIAKKCGVSLDLVNRLRRSLNDSLSENKNSLTNSLNDSDNQTRTYITKHGTQAKMNTANIGKGKSSESSPPSAEDPASIPESTQLEEDKEVGAPFPSPYPSAEENNQPSDTPLNIREIFSVGDLARIKEGHPEFGGQSGKITFIPDRHRAVIEFAPGKREVIQLFDFELPANNAPIDNPPTDNPPTNIREIFSVGDLARIKEDNPDFGGQEGKITFIPNRHCAVVEFAPGFRKVIQLFDFELPPPKHRKENSLAVGDKIKIKDDHYFGGQFGIITAFPNRDSVIVEFSPGKRELIYLKDLDLPQKPHPQRTKKKEIIIQEGLNYKAGCPGYGCKWYVEVTEQTYKRLQEYRQKVGTVTLDGAINRFLEEEEEKDKTPNSDDIVLYFLNNVQQLPRERVNLILEAFAKAHYDAFVQVYEVIEK